MLRLRNFIQTFKPTGRSFSTATEAVPKGPESYNGLMQFWHWGMAAGILGCFATVQYKQSIGTPKTDADKATVGSLMKYHKSFGLLMAIMIAPRIATRLFSTIPKHMGGVAIEHKVAKVSHMYMYFATMVMTGTGVGMGYFNGFGVPFFVDGWKMPGAAKED